MRGGRNKFGPMYKRDRARKMQVLRHKNAISSGSLSGITLYPGGLAANGNSSASTTSSMNNTGTTSNSSSMYTPQLHIKEEVQIPHVTSMTSSPDSSPSPVQLPMIAAAANGQSATQVITQQTDQAMVQFQIPHTGNKVRTVALTPL